MAPDLSIETRNAWLVLAGAAVVALGVLWYIWDGADTLNEQVVRAQAERDKLAGKSTQDMRQRVQQQIQANKELQRTIEKLKAESGFEVATRFTIPAGEVQPGYFFKRRFVEVRQGVREKAEKRSIRYDENIGFGTDDKVPEDSQAPYLMAMLQLTEKAILIAINTPEPLESMSITHGAAVDTGPDDRPTLLREYPLELKVHGNLTDILAILHSISQVDAKITSSDQKHDYPLILRGLIIQSENAKAKDDINEIDATFKLAGMQFLSLQEREHLPGMPGRPALTHATGAPHFQSHP